MLKVRVVDKFDRQIAIWNSYIGRSTSYGGDDAICIADLMGLDVSLVCKTPLSERAKSIYDMLPGIPQQIDFSLESQKYKM